jgi:hypothetical protein
MMAIPGSVPFRRAKRAPVAEVNTSEMGQTRRFRDVRGESAFPPMNETARAVGRWAQGGAWN